jgi:hypothetical protein
VFVGGPLPRCNKGRARTGVVGPDRHALRVVERCVPAATVHKALDALLTGLGIHCAGSPIDRLNNVVAGVAHVDPAVPIAPRRPARPVEAACHRAHISANRSRVNCRLDRHLVVKAEATNEEQHEGRPLRPRSRQHAAASRPNQPLPKKRALLALWLKHILIFFGRHTSAPASQPSHTHRPFDRDEAVKPCELGQPVMSAVPMAALLLGAGRPWKGGGGVYCMVNLDYEWGIKYTLNR